MYFDFHSLEEVQKYALKLHHKLVVFKEKYILIHNGNANRLTYQHLYQVVDFLQKLENSWKKGVV